MAQYSAVHGMASGLSMDIRTELQQENIINNALKSLQHIKVIDRIEKAKHINTKGFSTPLL